MYYYVCFGEEPLNSNAMFTPYWLYTLLTWYSYRKVLLACWFLNREFETLLFIYCYTLLSKRFMLLVLNRVWFATVRGPSLSSCQLIHVVAKQDRGFAIVLMIPTHELLVWNLNFSLGRILFRSQNLQSSSTWIIFSSFWLWQWQLLFLLALGRELP